MDAEPTKPLAAFGFLTVVESADHGLFGGFLVLSAQGRPLEFRCSTPIVATRAQEILYGPTLRPYLISEVIGATLIESASLPVRAIFVDLPEALALATLRPEPVYCVDLTEQGESVEVPRRALRVAADFEAHLAGSGELLAPLAKHIDLAEPFHRIRTALAEAQVDATSAGGPVDELAAAA